MKANARAIAAAVVPLAHAKPGDLVWDETLERARPLGVYHVRIRLSDGTERLLYNPQPKQDALHAAHAPQLLYGGQAGGGKSHALRWHGIINCARTPNLRVLLLRREHTDLEKSHLIDIQTEVPEELATYNAGLHRLIFANGSLLQFGHCHDMKALKAYLSSQWDLILIDEASLFPPDYLRLLKTRLRTKNRRIKPQFVLATNPGGEGHLWIYQRFITKRPPEGESRNYDPDEWEYIPSALEDNEYLETEEYDRQFSDVSEAEYAAYRQGNWEAFAGQFFSSWSRRIHVKPHDTEIPDWWEVAGCMDWGYAPNPGYVGWCAFDQYGRGWGYKELVFREMSAREVAVAIVEMCENEMERRMTIRGDSAMWIKQPETGVSIAEEINNTFAELGVEIVLEQANKDRMNGWHRFHQFLKPVRKQPETGKPGPWLYFLAPTPKEEADTVPVPRGCPYLIDTIGAQIHDEKKPGDMKKGATDHGCDAWRYLLISREPLTQLPPSKKPKTPYHKRVHNATRKLLQRAVREMNEENTPDPEAIEARLEGLTRDRGDEEELRGMEDVWN